MSAPVLSLLALSVLSVPALLSVPAARADALLDARALELGDTVALTNVAHPSQSVQWGRGEVVLDARPDEVLAVVQNYAQYAGMFPYFEKSRVLSQRGSDAIVYLEAKILHGAATLWSQVRMTASSPTPETHVIEVRMMKGKSNLGQLLARWEVTPVGDGKRTLVGFQLLVDPDLPVPDSLVSDELRKSAGQALRALRKRVTQHTSYAA